MAIHPYLATLLSSTTFAGSYAALGSLTKIEPPKGKVGDMNYSDLSVPNATHVFAPGWITSGELGATINFDKTNTGAIYGYYSARTVLFFKLRYNDGTGPTTGSVWAFTGYFNECGEESFSKDEDNPLQTSFKIKISGLPTFTAAT
jgi:hypothetical protein